MATTTPNYGWPVPTDTDYVKDGAAAIEALGDAIDATVFGLPAGSFTLITSATLSAVSNVSINNCFTSTYDNYRVIYASGGTTLTSFYSIRLRASGSDDSTSNYYTSRFTVGTSSGSFSSILSTSFATINNASATDGLSIVADICNPQKAIKTAVTANLARENLGFWGGVFNTTAQFDGFSLFANNGTMTGTIYVYGYGV